MSDRRFALVAGGGTGGHVIPALAVARALAEKHGATAVEVVGSSRGLDSRLVQGSGLPVALLPGSGLRRRASPSAIVHNVAAVVALGVAVAMAFAVVLRRRPAVVVAMGGYACLATSIAAWVLRVPVVLVNVDAVPGAANKLVAKFAKAAAAAFEGSELPRAVVTGAPVRDEILQAARPSDPERRRARQGLGIPDGRRVVAAVGGSLGARRLNEAVIGLSQLWSAREDLAIYHVVGRRDAQWADERTPDAHQALWYMQVPFEDDMASFYKSADVVVCRSGANTIAELTVVGVPSLLVPLPRSPGDHQTKNARVLEHAGAAVVVEDDACSPTRLEAELERLLSDDSLLESMLQAALGLGRPDALSAVVRLVEAEAKR